MLLSAHLNSLVRSSRKRDPLRSKRPDPDLNGRAATAIGSYTLLLARAGVESSSWHDPLQRIPVEVVSRIYEVVFDLTGDPCFGLEVSKHFRLSMLHALGHSLMASRSLRDFCTRFSRSLRLVSQGAQMNLIETEDAARLLVSDIATVVPAESEDVVCGVLVRTMKELTDGRFQPRRIELRRSAPAGVAKQHETFYGCPVVFERHDVSIIFDRTLLDVPLALGNEELAQLNDRVVQTYLARFDRADFENRVRSLVIEALPSGRVTKTSVALRLGVSARTLQARLGERGSSFVGLVNATRRTLACAYLDDPSTSIGEVAYLVGFSDTSNFTRAFRRWTGLSPSGHRAKSEQGSQSGNDVRVD